LSGKFLYLLSQFFFAHTLFLGALRDVREQKASIFRASSEIEVQSNLILPEQSEANTSRNFFPDLLHLLPVSLKAIKAQECPKHQPSPPALSQNRLKLPPKKLFSLTADRYS
jgi:hypothetical protein